MSSLKLISSKIRSTFLLCTLAFFGFSCISEPAKLVEVIKVDDLKEILSKQTEEIQVINYWAIGVPHA
jgi:hypothetical protein